MEPLFNEVSGCKKVIVTKNKKPTVKKYKKKPYVLFGKVWYGKLISGDQHCQGLMDSYKSDDLVGHLVICLTRLNYTYVEYLYAYFDSYVEFYEYRKKFTQKQNCFYEIVNFNQKPHFDIDMKLKDMKERYFPPGEVVSVDVLKEAGNLLVETLIRSIMNTMAPNVLNLEKDVLIYTSHGHDKLSYHIIIDHWCHHDQLESKAFFDKVILYASCLLHGRYTEFVDNSVYSTNQAFRLLGSHKYDNNRVKIFQSSYYYRGNLIKHIEDRVYEKKEMTEMQVFRKSLITFTAECNLLQSFYVQKNYKMISYDITEQDLKEIDVMLNYHFGTNFTIREVSYSRILLKRAKPSMCPLCKRVHLHENPVVTIYKDEVQWSCRRIEKEKFILGKLSNVKENLADITPPNEIQEEDDDFDVNVLSFGDFKFDLSKDISINDVMNNIPEKIEVVVENIEKNDNNNSINTPLRSRSRSASRTNTKNIIKKDDIDTNIVKNDDTNNTSLRSRSRSSSRTNTKHIIKKEQDVIGLLNNVSLQTPTKKNISFDGLNPW